MNYYKNDKNKVYAYAKDGSQDHCIGDKVKITEAEMRILVCLPFTPEEVAAKVAEAKRKQLWLDKKKKEADAIEHQVYLDDTGQN